MKVLMLTDHCCMRVIKMGIALGKQGVIVHYLNKRLSNPTFSPSLYSMSEYVSDEHLAQKLQALDHFDIIHVHNEPDSLGVIAKQVRPDMKVIFDAHDLFSVRIGVNYPDEKFVFANCDGFVFPSLSYQKHATELHGITKPMRTVYSMCNEDFVQDPQPVRFNALAYEGGLRIPENIDAPDEFKYHSYRDFRGIFRDITNRLRIPLIVFPANADAIANYQIPGVMIHNPLDYPTMMNYMSMCRWGFVGGPTPGIPQWDMAMPNKLFEFLAAGVPIIAINATELSEFVDRWKVGVCVDSIEEIPSVFEQSEKYRANVWFLQNKFTMENEIHKVVNLYKEVISK